MMIEMSARKKTQNLMVRRLILGGIGLAVIISLFALPMLVFSGNSIESVLSIGQENENSIDPERVRNVFNNQADEIELIHISGQYNRATYHSAFDQDFEILVRWLQENLDSLLDEDFSDSHFNNFIELELRHEKVVFPTTIDPLERFYIFFENLRHRVSASNIDWRYLEDQFEDYIDIIFIQQDLEWSLMGFVSYEDDLSILLDFFAENQDSLYNNESSSVNRFEVMIEFIKSDININDRYLNGYSKFYIDESLHDQLLELIENELRTY